LLIKKLKVTSLKQTEKGKRKKEKGKRKKEKVKSKKYKRKFSG